MVIFCKDQRVESGALRGCGRGTYHGFSVEEDLLAQVHHVEGQPGHAPRVRRARLGQSADGHVFVTDGLDLVHVRILLRVGENVESSVQLVQHLNDLHGAGGVRVGGAVVAEADDAGEEEGDTVVPLRRDRSSVAQLVGDADRQHGVE